MYSYSISYANWVVNRANFKKAISSNDFAAYCEWKKSNGEMTCGIRYEELVSLCVYEIQKLKNKINQRETTIL